MRDLEDEHMKWIRIKATLAIQKDQSNMNHKNPKGKVHPFFISLENEDLILHNCTVDTIESNNIIPLSIMVTIGLDIDQEF